MPAIRRRDALVAAAATAAVLCTVPALGDTPAAAGPESPPASGSHRVTLVTGDVVTVGAGKDPAVHVEQADRGGGPVAFHTRREGRSLYVTPADAEPAVRKGTVDRELFNVTGLVRQGLADARAARLPVLLTYPKDARVPKRELPGTYGKERAVPSVNGRAVEVRRARAADFWKSARDGGAKLRLDRRLRPVLDESVPQTGAPEAWKAGYDGKGVKVAVLDGGADANHPDLKGRIAESRSFVEGEDAKDATGHGTHVAATIAGTGGAADGRFKGVAPGADLLIGKVCGAEYCEESAILEGMEWAAKSGAKVVNISLGGGPSDGSDLLSRRVNELTAETGTLFVIAAGNDGCDACVNTPGAADAALTVGAVDKKDKLASFSSRGPRLTDAAAKPELTAPGVNISAARAQGTRPDDPAGAPDYVTLSGTSMAAPHVTGAAALLAQARPAAKAGGLKDALVSSAKDTGHQWHEQGAGRVDVPAALQPVSGPAAINAGRLAHDAKPGSKAATYTNTGPKPVTLKLSLSAKGWDGHTTGAAKLSATELTVPAGGTATADVTVDPAADKAGVYGGTLTASAEGVVLRTPVTWYREPKPAPTHTLTVKTLDSAGKPLTGTGAPYIYGQQTEADLPANDPFDRPSGQAEPQQTSPGVWTAEVPKGDYMMLAAEYANRPGHHRQTLLAATNVSVDGGTSVTLDARKAVPVRADAPGYTYNQALSAEISGITGVALTLGSRHLQDAELRATPVAAPAKGRLAIQETYTIGERTVRASSGGKDLPLAYDPLQTGRALAGKHKLPLAYAGSGSAADFKAAGDVKGKAVLVKLPPGDDPDDWWSAAAEAADKAAQRAEDAGAKALLPYVDAPGARPLAPLELRPAATPIAVLGVSRADGEKLRRAKTLDVSVRQNPGHMDNLHYAPPYGIPDDLTHEVDRDRLRRTKTGYHADKPGLTGSAWSVAFENDRAGTYQSAKVFFAAPARIDQYYGGVTGKQHWVRRGHLEDGKGGLFGQLDWEAYRGGSEDWFAGPLTMVSPDTERIEARGFQRGALTAGGGEALIASPYLGDSGTGHFANLDYGAVYPFAYRLFRAGKEIEGKPVPGMNTPYFEVPDAASDYRLDGTYTLPASGGYGPTEKVRRYSPKVRSEWTFRSAAGEAVPPLLQLRYRLGLALDNTAAAGERHRIDVTAAQPPGATDPARIAGLKLAYSTDAGKSWRRAEVRAAGDGRFTARLRHPQSAADDTVWLRTEAWDAAGNRVAQTAQQAYGLR